MQMIFFVLDDPDLLENVLEAWKQAGVGGVTILESTGLHRLGKRIPMPFAYTPGNLVEEGHMTLISIVKNETMVKACLKATEELVGDLNKPNTGVFASWKLDLTKGANSKDKNE